MFWFMFVLFFDVFCVSCFCLLFFLVILPVVLLFGGSVFDCFFFVCILFLLINFLCWSRCHTVSLWFDMIPKWSHWYHRNLIYGSVWFHYPKRYIYHQLQVGRYVMETIGNHHTISGFVPKMGMPRTKTSSWAMGFCRIIPVKSG